MEIDPEQLAAAGALCTRQQDHVQDIAAYLEGVLDRPEAFAGVLTVFAGSYAGAVAAGRRGLADSARAAGLMGRGMVQLRAEVLATDDEVARRMGRTRPGGRYDAPPGGGPTGGALPGGGGQLGGGGPAPVRSPLALRVLPGPPGGAGEHRTARWEQRSDAAADRWRARWDARAGRVADPGRYEAERRERRRVRGVADLALAPGEALRGVREQVAGLAGSVGATVDALGDLREQRELVVGSAATPAAADVVRVARGWWR